jgi:hypothetical protein
MRAGSLIKKCQAFLEGLDDLVVAVPDRRAEFVLPKIVPDVLHRVQFGCVGRQGQQGDIVGHLQLLTFLVPSGTVADQYCMGARRDLSADLNQVQVH